MSALAVAALAVACGGPEPAALPLLADADSDGILDVHEGDVDTDADGVSDRHDTDSDGDGWPDAVEAGDADPLTYPIDTDMDGVPDYLDQDSDGNGLLDADEGWLDQAAPDADADGRLDPFDLDDDNDGIPDVLEVSAGRDIDSDRDGDPDRRDVDSDDDGIGDVFEGAPLWSGVLPDRDDDGVPDVRDLDSDGDGLLDAEERGEGAEPRDTEADGIADYRDRDSDDDGLADDAELGVTHPYMADTDGDGVRDGVERILGSDPADVESMPAGRVMEVRARNTAEEAVQLEIRSRRSDVVFVVDGTHRYPRFGLDVVGPSLDAAKSIVGDMQGSAVAMVTAGESPYMSQGGIAEFLYRIDMPVTDEVSSVIGVDGWDPNGDSSGGSVIEAAMQALTGRGYDLPCDGAYDAQLDILPWTASPADPFGGGAGGFADSFATSEDRGPGVGLRQYAAPIVVLARMGTWWEADLEPLIRDVYGADPDELSEMLDWLEPPGGCPRDSGSTELLAELERRRGLLVVFEPAIAGPEGSFNRAQAEWLLDRQGIYVDVDGDGVAAERPYLSVQFTASDVDTVVEQLVDLVRQAIDARAFAWAELKVVDDPHGMVVDISPKRFDIGEDSTADVAATVTLRGTVPPTRTDRVIPIDLVVAAEGEVAVADVRWWVVVPGTGVD